MSDRAEVNPLLAVACERVLRRFGRDGELSGAVFNKIMTLLNRRLLESREDQRVDLALPHCWYLFGDEVVPRELPKIVLFEPAEAPAPRTRFKVNPSLPRPEAPHDWQAVRLGDELRLIENEFGNPVDLSGLVEEVYEGAPFDFQRAFLDLRRLLRFRDELWRLENPVEGMIRPLFERGLAEFPAAEFPQMRRLTPQFRRLGRFALSQGNPAVDYFDQLSEEYWQAFCYFLRIHDGCHFHVSQGRLDYWSRVAPEYLASSGPRMTFHAEELVSAFGATMDPIDRAVLVGTDWGVKTSADSSGEVDTIVHSQG